ncbi:hypothetical protein [Crateriforma conspicua]|uniref:Mu-like prophage major head subunit gpT n=1 Tax=Crateriforma conspicua TaxID=2527996 RepID=A0A5C6FYT5_9PLAN|nr:hypothetical protein [Crateriforma conspicua]TWU66460.1 hypothetical protein V7x_20260 [Crateriforma conspicua]
MAYSPAQLSYLTELGMDPDASDATADGFVRSLPDADFAEFERIGAEIEPDGSGAGSGGSASHGDPTSGDPNSGGDDVQRGESGAGGEGNGPSDDGGNGDAQERGFMRRLHHWLTGEVNGRGESSTDPTPVDPAEVARREVERHEQIRRERAEFIHSQAGDDVPADVVQRALRENWDQERVSREFLREVRTRPAPAGTGGGHVGIISRSHEGSCTLEALQGAILLRDGFSLDDDMFRRREAQAMLRRTDVRAGWITRVAQHNGGDIERADRDNGQYDLLQRSRDEAHRFAGYRMLDFAREAIRLSGRQVPDDETDMIHRAMSTAALTAVFSTSVNMQILQAYLGIDDSTRGWCFENMNVPNFMKQERGRLTKASGMKKLARGGAEANPIEFSDETEEYKIARYAGQFTLDEQDFIDDSFGAMSPHTTIELGELAGELRPDLVYSILIGNPDMRDGKALFHADHGNLETGAALGESSLETARANMVLQVENGRSIRNSMRYLIVPESLDFTARRLINSSETRQASTTTAVGTSNPHHKRFDVRSDPRLDNGVTDPDSGTFHAGSTTNWFGASARVTHGIEVGYRRGTGGAPRMETFVLTGARWGMGWKCNMDLGAKAIDWRGLHKSTN